MSDFLEVAEVAEVLGVTRQAVYRLCDRGTLAFVWRFGRRLIRESAVHALLADAGYRSRTRRVEHA